MPAKIAVSPLRLVALSLLPSVLVLGACARTEAPPEPVRAVKLMTVGLSPMTVQDEYAGEVRARTESRVGFRVPGKLLLRPVEVGQHVRAGQLLAQLDARDFELAAAAARAQVTAATTQRDLAAADTRRFEALRAQNFISGAEFERREASLKSAQASLAQAQAQAASQGNQAGYTRLLADANGIVTGVDAEPGQVVGAGMAIVRLALDGARDVVFSVPEDKVARMAVGQVVAVRRWAGGPPLQATVREVAAAAEPMTRTFAVKASIDGDGEALPLGSTVTVLPSALSAKGAQAIMLPTTALMKGNDGTAVWVFDSASSTVRMQPVQLVAADGNHAVVANGLAPGMQVVAAGVHVLAPGQKVTVYEEKYGLSQDGRDKIAINSVVNRAVQTAAATAKQP